ncbi:MAG TPA: DUF6519 domain-containing protein [Rhizomicrobium sp.]|jgi:hypothetical protein
MKNDITRETYRAFRHYSGVLMQQGRVQLDADWNEQVAINHHYLRQLTIDLVGPVGVPAGNAGFIAMSLDSVAAKPGTDIAFTPGHCYVDGILCECDATAVPVGFAEKTVFTVPRWVVDGVAFDAGQYLWVSDTSPTPVAAPMLVRIASVDFTKMQVTPAQDVSAFSGSGNVRIRRFFTFLTQPDYMPPALPAPGTYQMYLDVWERLIGYVENDAIREVALNGPDTAGRSKVVWQVKLLPAANTATNSDGNPVCITPQALTTLLQPGNLALLRARTQPAQTSDDPCTIAPDSLYRGPENQLYRVEIHDGSLTPDGKPQQPTFKWSRENGAVVFPIVSGAGTSTLTLENLGRDDRFTLNAGDFVEVQDDVSVLQGCVTRLYQVQSIDRSRLTVTLNAATNTTIGGDPTRHPLLRRWDHKQGDASAGGLTLASDNAAQVVSGSPAPWLNLEDGVQVQFSDPASTVYRPGDYWLIPARVATGDVEWPSETILLPQNKSLTQQVALPSFGVVHHYAPMAVVTISANGFGVANSCMPIFPTLEALATSRLTPLSPPVATPAAPASPAPPPRPASPVTGPVAPIITPVAHPATPGETPGTGGGG